MAMASAFLVLLLFHGWVMAYNDMNIDQNLAPVAGTKYNLTWSNPKGSQVNIDLDEVTDPGKNPDTKAGIRVGDGVSNIGYYLFLVPQEVRSNIQYQFQIRNNEDSNSFSFSNSFYIFAADGTGLPSIAFGTSNGGLVFGITKEAPQTSDEASAAVSTSYEAASTTDDSSSPSSSSSTSLSTTDASNTQTTSPAIPTKTAPRSSSGSSRPTSSIQEQSAASSSPNPSSHNLSDGAIAGIAISMLLLGLAIGAVAFFFFRRRRQRQRQRHGDQAVAEMQVKRYSDKEVATSPNSSNPSDGTSPTTTNDRHTWMSSTHSPLSELAANPVQGSELEASEYVPPSESRAMKSAVGSGSRSRSSEGGDGDGDQSETQRMLLELPERGSSVRNTGGEGERHFRIDG